MARSLLYLGLTSLLVTRTARADDLAAMHLELGLASFATSIGEAKAALAGIPSITPAQCRTVIADARAAGIAGSHSIRRASLQYVHAARKVGADYVLTLDQAPSLCDEFAGWYHLAEAKAVLDEGQRLLGWLHDVDPATTGADNGAKLRASATRCVAELDRLVAAGAPTNLALPITGLAGKLTITDGRIQICNALASAAATFATDVRAAKAARRDQIVTPLEAVGISGDRLQLLTDHAGYAFYGVGGRELVSPKQLQAATLVFEQSRADDGTYAVTRYKFWGDRLVGTTRQTFIREPGSAAFK